MGKRSYGEMASSSSASPFIPMFESFRTELDEHHDRRERIIKASRDITAASKKIIFTLQRWGTLPANAAHIRNSIRELLQPLPQHVTKANKQYYETIANQFKAVAHDLQGINSWRYAKQISGGCQEWMEAASFQHYLTNATLLSHEDAASQLQSLDPDGPAVSLSAEDYLLGIYDMTGELMRFSITSMATSGVLPTVDVSQQQEAAAEVADAEVPNRNVLNDLRTLRSALESLNAHNGPLARDVEKKMEVMQTSVEKVERSLYSLVVRGAERPKGWVPDADGGSAISVES